MSLSESATRLLVQRTPLRNRATRKKLIHARRRLFEAVGADRYSRPAHDGLDLLLAPYLPSVGTFVEAGANDGYTWSNTYYLERFRGWNGVLIEGIPTLAEECRRLRRRSQVYNCALVDSHFADDHVTMTYSDLCSLIEGSEQELERELLSRPETPFAVRVPARTLSDVLDEAGVSHIDFLSLDLEGFEAPALRGLDLDRHRPTWMLIEVDHGEGRAAVEEALGARYDAAAELTAADVLYRLRARQR